MITPAGRAVVPHDGYLTGVWGLRALGDGIGEGDDRAGWSHDLHERAYRADTAELVLVAGPARRLDRRSWAVLASGGVAADGAAGADWRKKIRMT